MDTHIIIFALALLLYCPLAITLLYVWRKFGKGEKYVALAQAIFLIGTGVIILGMLFI